ncbi:hypothetical protein MUP01_02345, partial [Candidatus Bathyarchaeota archaeon]|nr:hypothetical protein [Candidatus Bathyarchaeota archaeon]
EPPYYFELGPLFIASCTKGEFNGTFVVMMGCEGLSNTWMARVFVDKGAKAYVSWNGSVSSSHTDQSTITLLQHLILEKQTIRQAVENTMIEVGPDPTYDSELTCYPLEAWE